MPLGSAASDGSSGENISHFAAIRIRLLGAGRLHMFAIALDDTKFKTLVPFAMKMKDRILPTRIINFKEQRACFVMKTTGTNEYFRINRVIIFARESDSSHYGA